MKRLLITLLITLSVSCYFAYSQDNTAVEKWKEYIDELAETTEDDEQIELLYTELSYLSEHPLNLNEVTAETLKRLPFLSDNQIDDIVAYRTRYGNMASVYELKNIESLDWETIELLSSFVYADATVRAKRELSLKNLKYGSSEFVLRYDRTFPLKNGYKPLSDSALQQSPNSRYLGHPYYNAIRYSYSFDDRLQAGLVMETDAGEPFLNSRRKGYDYYSAHIVLRNTGILKTLALGDYKASFGQGLALSQDFSPSMSIIYSQAERRNNGFRRHYSTSETGYFRGAAATVELKSLDISLFASMRKEDGTVADGEISSFKTDGLHRRETEWEKRNTITTHVYGGNIRFESEYFSIGATALTYDFGGLSVNPTPHPYNLFYFRGKRNANGSIDYYYRHRKFRIFGETAISQNGAVATLDAFRWTPTSYLSGLILFRSYARDYQAYYGKAFAQNSTVQNEQGLYMGLQFNPIAHWKLSGYADFYRFPWLKYEVDAPSEGQEYMLQADYTSGGKYAAYLRYRYRAKESNRTIGSENETLPYYQHRWRWQFVFTPRTELSSKTAIDVSLYDEEQGSTSRGYALSQSVSWKGNRLQADIFAAYFNTDDYDSRISSYEKKLLYVYNSTFLYGKGVRCSAVVRYFILKRLALSAKVGWTHYTDRDTIGSDLEMIEGSNRTDLDLMLRWTF